MIVSPYLDKLKDFHQFQGASNDCGPTCTAIILNLHKGSNIFGGDLGQRMNGVHWKGIFPIVRRIPKWATFPWGIKNVLRTENLDTKWRIFQKKSKLLELLGSNAIVIVIIGNYQPLWSHYKILVAYNESDGWGFIDPAYRSREIQWNTCGYFLKHWKKFGNQIIYINSQ